MSRKLDLSGREFGRLTVGPPLPSRNGRSLWLCLCSCTKLVEVTGKNLMRGYTKSCGCLKTEALAETWKKVTKHGQSRRRGGQSTRTYNSWFSMKNRVDSQSATAYHAYGAKGITYDPSWTDFDQFFADMGERPAGTSLDRIDGSKGYSKDNCRWATPREQQDNRAITRKFKYGTEILTISDVAERFNIPRPRVVYYLTEKHVSVAEMLEVLNGKR